MQFLARGGQGSDRAPPLSYMSLMYLTKAATPTLATFGRHLLPGSCDFCAGLSWINKVFRRKVLRCSTRTCTDIGLTSGKKNWTELRDEHFVRRGTVVAGEKAGREGVFEFWHPESRVMNNRMQVTDAMFVW